MSGRSRSKGLYQRGSLWLDWDKKRDGSLRSPYLTVYWYDAKRKRIRSASTGTTDVQEGQRWLDAYYLRETSGRDVCPTCHRPFDHTGELLLLDAMVNYQSLHADSQASAKAISARLAHVTDFIVDTGRTGATCGSIDEVWVAAFRTWMAKRKIVSPKGKTRNRSLGTIENSVIQLAAAIRFAKLLPDFKPIPTTKLNNTPTYRSDVAELAAMFLYCIAPEGDWSAKERARRIRERASLHRFLMVSVATWARPDAVYDLSTDPERQQWISKARVVALNPKGRIQTKKRRPTIPAPHQLAIQLDAASTGFFVGTISVRSAWRAMAAELGLPEQGAAGSKLIRRSMMTLARKRLGEEHWIQGRIMAGHVADTTSDIYALRAMENMGKVLAATEEIIDEIEALAPGAFPLPDRKGQIVA
jgi:hypothetical protein